MLHGGSLEVTQRLDNLFLRLNRPLKLQQHRRNLLLFAERGEGDWPVLENRDRDALSTCCPFHLLRYLATSRRFEEKVEEKELVAQPLAATEWDQFGGCHTEIGRKITNNALLAVLEAWCNLSDQTIALLEVVTTSDVFTRLPLPIVDIGIALGNKFHRDKRYSVKGTQIQAPRFGREGRRLANSRLSPSLLHFVSFVCFVVPFLPAPYFSRNSRTRRPVSPS